GISRAVDAADELLVDDGRSADCAFGRASYRPRHFWRAGGAPAVHLTVKQLFDLGASARPLRRRRDLGPVREREGIRELRKWVGGLLVVRRGEVGAGVRRELGDFQLI